MGDYLGIDQDFENIILVGFMAAGKSSVGKILARRLGWDYIDTDDQIVKITGLKIPELFKKYGEVRFRAEENLVIKRLKGVRNKVIATGGGTIVDRENWDILKELGVIVHLFVPLEESLKRAKRRKERPLLTKSEEELRELWYQRLVIYNKANIFVDTTNDEVENIVEEILIKLKGGYINDVAKN